MNKNQIKIAAFVSYFSIAFNVIAGLIYTPWMISKIGQNNYGLYTLATSLISMLIMDFGIGAAVTRFISKYNAEKNQESVNNLLGLVYKLYILIDTIIFISLIVLYFFIDKIYVNFSAAETDTFKVLYLIVGLFSIISFPFSTLNGILTAYEQFAKLKFCDLFHKAFIIIAMVLALLLGGGVYSLVLVNAISGLLSIAIKLLIIKYKTPIKVNFKFLEKKLFKEVFSFSVWTTISSIAQRLTINISPSIIAAVSHTGATGSAIFGLATTIEGYVFTFANAINGMFMPRISKIVHENKKESELIPLMIKVGRLQCMLIGVLCIGIICLGKSFIVDIWHKPDFSESYLCAVFLVLPSFFHLPMQIANTTLIVENKVKLQSYIYIVMCLVNIICSLFASKYYGSLGASFSIFLAYMARTMLLTFVYSNILRLNMKKFYKETFLKISPVIAISIVTGFLLDFFNPITNKYMRFCTNGVFLVLTFFVLAYVFFMNSYEKQLIFSVLKKLKLKQV